MANVKLSVMCNAIYHTHYEVPDEVTKDKGELVKYLREHIEELNIEDIEYLGETDPEAAITEDDIIYVDGGMI